MSSPTCRDMSVTFPAKLIVGSKQVHQKKRQRIKANANLQTTNDFQGGSPSHFNIGRLHELIVGPAWNPTFKEAQTANKSLTHIVDDSSKSQLIVESKSEGAQAAPNLSSQLIVASINSKISFHFCDNCRMFREGVKGATAILNGLFGRNLAFGLISASAKTWPLAAPQPLA